MEEDIGEYNDLQRPGRWSWRSYKLNGSAVTAIIIGLILALAGFLLAAFAAYKFINLFIHPPKESDEVDEDDDD